MTASIAPRYSASEELASSLIHGLGIVLSIAGLAALVAVAARAGDARHVASVCVYGASLILLYTASTLYHGIPHERAKPVLRVLDHAAIFLLIAGTYTPFALISFRGWLPVAVLVCVWSGAALGLVLNLAWIGAPAWVTAPAYLLVGWVGVIAAPQLFTEVGVPGAVLLVVGGALYTVGALTYATQWPNPFPRTFGFHEVFHLLVVAAVTLQLVAVYLVAA